MRGLHAESAGDPKGFAGLQSEKEVMYLEGGPTNGVDETQTAGDGPANVDSCQVFRGYFTGIAPAKMEASQAEPYPLHDH